MSKLLNIKMDNFVNGTQKGVPVTLGFTLETDGTPPPAGSHPSRPGTAHATR